MFSERGKLSSGMSQRELFDIMEDLAVETYYNKDLTAKDISYEPVNENTDKS